MKEQKGTKGTKEQKGTRQRERKREAKKNGSLPLLLLSPHRMAPAANPRASRGQECPRAMAPVGCPLLLLFALALSCCPVEKTLWPSFFPPAGHITRSEQTSDRTDHT